MRRRAARHDRRGAAWTDESERRAFAARVRTSSTSITSVCGIVCSTVPRVRMRRYRMPATNAATNPLAATAETVAVPKARSGTISMT